MKPLCFDHLCFRCILHPRVLYVCFVIVLYSHVSQTTSFFFSYSQRIFSRNAVRIFTTKFRILAVHYKSRQTEVSKILPPSPKIDPIQIADCCVWKKVYACSSWEAILIFKPYYMLMLGHNTSNYTIMMKPAACKEIGEIERIPSRGIESEREREKTIKTKKREKNFMLVLTLNMHKTLRILLIKITLCT